MRRHVTLSTIVEEEFAKKISDYCSKNGLTPSSLIKSLLEEEIMAKQPITSIYDKIEKNFKALAKLNLEALHQTATSNFLIAHYILKEDNIPPEHIDTLNTLKAATDRTLKWAENYLKRQSSTPLEEYRNEDRTTQKLHR